MGGFFSMLFASSSRYDIRKIKIGDTQDDVRLIFGDPESTQSSSSRKETWTYTIPFRVFVSIEFDERGLVTRTYRSGEAP